MLITQQALEHTLHSFHISQDIKTYLKEQYDIDTLLSSWLNYINQEYWESKNTRLNSISHDTNLILNILTQTILLAQNYIPLVNLCSAINYTGLNKQQSIQTNAELLHVIDNTNPELLEWDITDNSKRIIKSCIQLPKHIQDKLTIQCVLPPMLSKPRVLKYNKSSAYYTIGLDSLILGDKHNYHDDCISLDVLNTLNQQALVLDKEIPYLFETNIEQKEQFEYFRDLLKDKHFYLTYKVDKRGRVYSQGYHFNIQGSSFEKACISLSTYETVIGEL